MKVDLAWQIDPDGIALDWLTMHYTPPGYMPNPRNSKS